MKYKVLRDFIAKEHDGELYRKGDEYPKEGFKATAKRVAFLRETHPTFGVVFLGDEVKAESKAPETPEKTDETPTGKEGGEAK